MRLSPLQVCIDSTDWFHERRKDVHCVKDLLTTPIGTIHDESGMDSSPSRDMPTCSRALIERKLSPPRDQALKCPRCKSNNTKFCYYNNYSLSQPRYFCKACRRYWTKGGSLRNIPVGGSCRKNKKISKRSSEQSINQNPGSAPSSHHHNPTHLHLSFPQMQLSKLSNILHAQGMLPNPNSMENKYNIGMLENPRPTDFMEIKVGNSRSYDFMGIVGLGDMSHDGLTQNVHGICSTFGMSSIDGKGGNLTKTCQRLLNPYYLVNDIDMKPNPKPLSLEWEDQGCSDGGKDLVGNLSNFGTWSGLINGDGSSVTNQLV